MVAASWEVVAAAAVLQRLEAEECRMVVMAAERKWLMAWLGHYCILGVGGEGMKDDRNEDGEHSVGLLQFTGSCTWRPQGPTLRDEVL